MFKLIIFVVGLAIGFGGGVYWGVNHPKEASRIAAREKADVQKVEHVIDNSRPAQP